MTSTGPSGLASTADGRAVHLSVRIQPGARRAGPAGRWNGLLKLAVSAPPEDGRANAAACSLLAELFGLRPSAVELVRGHSARIKTFRLALAPAPAAERLRALLATASR